MVKQQMSKKIHLSENHTRALSSSLIVVEKSLTELEDMLQKQSHTCCNVILKDVDYETIENNISTIQEAKKYIYELAYKNSYNCFVSHRSGETVDSFISDLTELVSGHSHESCRKWLASEVYIPTFSIFQTNCRTFSCYCCITVGSQGIFEVKGDGD